MLYSTAGTRLYIGRDPRFMPSEAGAWVEIGETEALGMLGVEWEVQETTVVGCDLGDAAVSWAEKGARRSLPMQIILGNNPEDGGQAILWEALYSSDYYFFRLLLPDGVRSRVWRALVTSMSEVFDTANSVMKLQADLRPHHDPISRENG